MIRFQHVEYLWLLLIIPVVVVLYLLFLNWKKQKIRKIGDPELSRQLLKGRISGRVTTRFVLLCLSLVCIVLALANLQAGGQAEKSQRKGIDVLFALDVSKSMLAKDVSPNRLEKAKELIYRMIDQMQNDRTGLIVFAGKAYLQVPLTIDYGAMKMMLTSVSPDMIPTQGTVLAEALQLSEESFSAKEKKHKAIVLISDGEDHDKNALDQAAELHDKGTIIYTVGVGSASGSPIFDPATGRNKVDQEGNVVISKLNEDELKAIAQTGGGSYHLLTNTGRTADQLLSAIKQMETKNLGTVVFTNYKSYFPYFLGAALLLLIVEWLLPSGRRKSVAQVTTGLLVIGLTIGCCLPTTARAQQPQPAGVKKTLREGNEKYKEKNYKAAIGAYQKAIKSYPGSFTGQFNLGDALYQSGQPKAARKALEASLPLTKDKTQKAQAWHNIGNTYLREKNWQAAANAFKESLLLEPNDPHTKYNLAYAQAMMKNNQGGGGSKNKNDQDNKQDKNNPQQENNNKDQQNKQQGQNDPSKKDPQPNKQGSPKEDKQGQDKKRPQPQRSRLSDQQAENLLNALTQEEKKLHDKKEKGEGIPIQPEKDW